jgi:hypothetical protein
VDNQFEKWFKESYSSFFDKNTAFDSALLDVIKDVAFKSWQAALASDEQGSELCWMLLESAPKDGSTFAVRFSEKTSSYNKVRYAKWSEKYKNFVKYDTKSAVLFFDEWRPLTAQEKI